MSHSIDDLKGEDLTVLKRYAEQQHNWVQELGEEFTNSELYKKILQE